MRLLRILRYSARMGFNMESRTHEWFDLAMERGLNANLEGAEVGHELRALAREDNPVATLKLWESHGLLEAIHPKLQRRKPDYDSLNKLTRVRGNYLAVGLRPRLHLAVTTYTLGRLKAREMAAALRNMEFRTAEIDAIANLVPEAQRVVKALKGRRTNMPRDAYTYLASLPAEMLAFIEVELPNPRALSKIRNYIQKWRPLRLALPIGELDALGIPRGPQFDKILNQLFDLQLRGKARTPEDRTRILRDLAGIKDEVKKKPEREKKKTKGGEAPAASAKTQGGKPGEKASAAAASEAGQHAAAAIGAGARAKHEKAAAARRAANAKSKPHHSKKSRTR